MNVAAENRTSTQDQKRAADALRKIRSLSGKQRGYYVSYVSGLPATIVMNGLGQALATELAKDKGKQEDHFWLYKHLADWLMRQVAGHDRDEKQLGEFLGWLMEQDQQTYVRAQAETMAYLNWLKQFARAFLTEKHDGQDG